MVPTSDREWTELAQRAARAFAAIPNVHSVGVGGRRRDNRPTGEPVLVVLVSEKLPRERLASHARVPAVFEGVATDVVQAGRPRLATAPAGATWGGPYDDDGGRHRPLRGGSRISGAAMKEFFGTLGFFMRWDLPSPLILAITTHHTLFGAAGTEVASLEVGQPKPSHSSWNCCRGVFGDYLTGVRDASMDAAAIVLFGQQEYYAQIDELGVVTGTHDVTQAEANGGSYAVRKRGSGTGQTGGNMHAINLTSTDGTIQNYMSILPNAASSGRPTFADHGDSGAAVVNDAGELVGLLWGIGDDPAQIDIGWGYAWPISNVISRLSGSGGGFDLILEVASTPDEKRISPGPPAASGVSAGAPPIVHRLEADLAHIPEGQRLTALWLKHMDELGQIVTRSKRTAVLWQRSGGAALLQCMLRMAHDPRVVFPTQIDGRPIEACVAEVMQLFARHGSPELQRDLETFRGMVPPLGGRSYDDLLVELAMPHSAIDLRRGR
ncbi:MAG TPA: hypothetical protein VHT91_37565 [Kofleriaceae bacterium]|nr:hypothetical protein [Kofleriaceae bacterium]